MTAVPPRPAAVEVCRCGHPLVNHWQTGKQLCMACPDGRCLDFTPRPHGPVTTAGGGLREAIAVTLWLAQPEYYVAPWDEISETTRDQYRTKADAVLALPALRDVLAAAARVRDVHEPDGTEPHACRECGEAWPCCTIHALDEA